MFLLEINLKNETTNFGLWTLKDEDLKNGKYRHDMISKTVGGFNPFEKY